MEQEKIIRELVKVIKRLSLNNSRMMVQYDQFRDVTKKIETAHASLFSVKQKQALSDWGMEYKYYQGKVMAYWVCLAMLVGDKAAEDLIFRGVRGDKNYDKYGRKIKKKK